jgi:hypothetical protein
MRQCRQIMTFRYLVGSKSVKMHPMSSVSSTTPEPNFARLLTDQDLAALTISAHALRRFVQRLRPGIPGADQVAEAMAALEALGSGNRSGPEQVQLNRYRNWMAANVEPHVLELIRCEGFWATGRPRWSMSRTPSDGLLQVGRMCLFPSVVDGRQIVLTTCTHGTNITWDIALERGYTGMPKPYIEHAPQRLRPPSWPTIAARAWRSRARHKGLLTAFRTERTRAIEHTRHENERAAADHQAAKDAYFAQRERAQRLFRERHR